MTDRQQSAFFFAIVFLFTSGIGLVIYRQYDQYYQQKTDIAIETAQTPSVALKKSSASSTGAQVRGWKTYKNTEYGFEFEYPQNYWVSTTTQTNVGPDIESTYASIDFRNSQPTESPSGIYNINGQPVQEYPLGGNMDGGIDYEVYFQDKNLDVLYSTKLTGYEDKLKEFKIISSTFKFTK